MGFIGLIRLLALGLVIWMIWRFVRRKSNAIGRSNAQLSGSQMVACAVCGTHVPEQDAIEQSGKWFCCIEHKEQHSD